MQTTGKTDLEILRESLVDYERVEFRFRSRIRGAGAGDADEREARGGGRTRLLLVDPKCKELIKDFEQVLYKEGSQAIDKDRDTKRTHLSDALGYLVWQECAGAGGWAKWGRGFSRRQSAGRQAQSAGRQSAERRAAGGRKTEGAAND